jgi:DNA polymerase-3 subunit delta'
MVCNLGSSCAFKAKENAAAIQDLILRKIAALEEKRKEILEFCIEMFRQALLINYETQV